MNQTERQTTPLILKSDISFYFQPDKKIETSFSKITYPRGRFLVDYNLIGNKVVEASGKKYKISTFVEVQELE